MPIIERHPIAPGEAGRQEWLDWRKQDVTASVVGALFDVHPYVTAMHLWAQHRGVEFEAKPETKRMRRGRKLESIIGEEVAELRPEWTIEAVNAYYRDATLHLGATPDFFILGDGRGQSRGVLQVKTADQAVLTKQWDNARVPPAWIDWQVRCEMLLTDAAFGAIAVLEPNNWDVYIFDIERDAGGEEILIATVQAFWESVAQGIEPQPDFSRDADVIKMLTQHQLPGLVRDLSGNNELPEMLAARATMSDAIKAYEARCEAIEAEIKFLLGEAEQATGLNGWRITYRTESRKEYVVKARSSRVLRIYDKRETA